MLRADQATVRFRGREEELDKLPALARQRAAVAVALVTGPGGQGKTRLARELCLQMRKNGWLAGFADNTERATGAAERLADSRLPVLLAVDYAEPALDHSARAHRGDELPSNRVRLLLLARSARDWWDRVRQQHASVPAMKQALPYSMTAPLAAPEHTASARGLCDSPCPNQQRNLSLAGDRQSTQHRLRSTAYGCLGTASPHHSPHSATSGRGRTPSPPSRAMEWRRCCSSMSGVLAQDR